MKRCSKCGEEKEPDAFYANGRGGMQSQCKDCKRLGLREWVANHPEAKKQYRRAEYAKLKSDPARYAAVIDRNRACRAQKRSEDPSRRRRERSQDWAALKANTGRHEKHLRKRRGGRDLAPKKTKAQITARAREYQSRTYHADAIVAATRRAKTTLSQSMGIPVIQLPIGLIEAKAAQLLVRRFVRKGK